MERDKPGVSNHFYTGFLNAILFSIPIWIVIFWAIGRL